MLHRVKKENDQSHGKWLGVGGHVEKGETPKECIIRETLEETGLTLDECRYRGKVEFFSDIYEDEIMYIYTSSEFHGELIQCNEGDLKWIPKEDIMNLNLWEGDRIFLKYLLEDQEEFHLKVIYEGDNLTGYEKLS